MKSSNPDIERVLSIDTGHLAPRDIKLLEADAARTLADPLNLTNNGGCIIVWKHPTGYILHIDEPDTDEGDYTELFDCAIEHGYSTHLVRTMKLAQMYKCTKLMFGRCGSIYDELPRFDSEKIAHRYVWQMDSPWPPSNDGKRSTR